MANQLSNEKKTMAVSMLCEGSKGEPQCVTVLEIPPVDSAETPVQAAIVAGGK